MRFVALLSLFLLQSAQGAPSDQYQKYEYMIPMRDGVKLYTSVYVPKNHPGKHPILMERTPYSAGPYGKEVYPRSVDGASQFGKDGFILAFQDVRGKYMSEGQFEDVRPILQGQASDSKKADESTDAYDTIEYLIHNVPDNNGRVGMRGVSYPGFYAVAAGIRSHPALKAISPQAPVSDWWKGDDDHRNGALFLLDCLEFNAGGFGLPRTGPGPSEPEGIRIDRKDPYDFYLALGANRRINEKLIHGKIRYWNDVMAHPNYDEFWQARNLGDKLRGIRCAVLTVGGLFDAEDLYGAFNVYRNAELLNPGIDCKLVMGPWTHGGWGYGNGRYLDGLDFQQNTGVQFRNEIEAPFFRHYLLEDGPGITLPEVRMFQTGSNRWMSCDQWPPKPTREVRWYVSPGQALSQKAPAESGFESYVSDPSNPVPYTLPMTRSRGTRYMTEDQRPFQARKDLLTLRSAPLDETLSTAGPVVADMWVKTTGTDMDLVVKVIDESPDGTMRLVRANVMRGRFREDPSRPIPFKPNTATRVRFELPGICHAFLAGHRVTITVQSSWFPLMDRNPQTFADINTCDESAFKSSTISLLYGPNQASNIKLLALSTNSSK
ncbi:MAG: CocE/NonD family hydrolase [Chthonomonas sp.]|nr:CocE/NonD family hydrolase [Chthonomonas sp.]